MEKALVLQSLVLTILLFAGLVNAEGQFCPLSQLNQQQSVENKLLVFVSFSIPEQSLKQLAKQVKEMDGVLVLRGLHNNSYKQTLQKIYQITKDSEGGFVIDPRLFEEFKVETVPTFVLKKPEGQFNKVVGNASLGYIIDKLRGGV